MDIKNFINREHENIARFNTFAEGAMEIIKKYFTDDISFEEGEGFTSTASYETDEYILTVTLGVPLSFIITVKEKNSDKIVICYKNEFGRCHGGANISLVTKYNLGDFDREYTNYMNTWKKTVWTKPYDDVP
jgi:hypothetical protein